MKIKGKEWQLEQDSFDRESLGKYESLFFLGNGFLGFRGNLEESGMIYDRGTYINGFYETEPFRYGESAYGYPKDSQTILDLPDGKSFSISMDGELFTLVSASDHRRVLDMRRGILVRTFNWKTASGAAAEVSITRLVSLTHVSIAVQIIEFTFASVPEYLEIVSSIEDPEESGERGNEEDPRKGSSPVGGGLERVSSGYSEGKAVADYMTVNSGLSLSTGMSHMFSGSGKCSEKYYSSKKSMDLHFSFSELEERLTFVKFLSYRHETGINAERNRSFCMDDLSFCREKGWKYFFEEQRTFLDGFWEKSDIKFENGHDVQSAIRFNLFHLLQSAGRNGRSSIAAKGLSGIGYDGHYFWDSEIYVVPFFMYTDPVSAKSLLSYRYSVLDHARKRAEELSHKGALYPWRTINGRESSAYFPAGTAQYHINADIAYTVDKYVEITGDTDFLKEGGFEILAETARFWSDFGNYIPSRNGAFCIHEVTGPDEYTALVNNNYYTNIMARNNLEAAVKWYLRLEDDDPDFLKDICLSLKLSQNEVDAWRKAAANMYLPYDAGRDLIPQDDSFLDRPVWDFDSTPRDKYPLLLHFHPLTIYRFQVLKQADVVMALFLKNDLFSFEEKKRNFDYYEKLTTGDSSLSAAIQGVIAMELGYENKGLEYFMKTLFMDYMDINGNVQDGIHTAAMGGSWIMIVYGFAGMREIDGKLSFAPRLPDIFGKISFRIVYRGSILRVTVGSRISSFKLVDGPSVEITVNGKNYLVAGTLDITAENSGIPGP